MKTKIREIEVFSLKIEKERLGKDEKTIINIFSVLEDYYIPCECVAKNIDWISITIRIEYLDKIMSVMQQLSQDISRINMTLIKDMTLLVVEEYIFTTRHIGMILRCLEMQGIEIMMFRKIKDNPKLVIGVRVEQFEKAKDIVLEEL